MQGLLLAVGDLLGGDPEFLQCAVGELHSESVAGVQGLQKGKVSIPVAGQGEGLVAADAAGQSAGAEGQGFAAGAFQYIEGFAGGGGEPGYRPGVRPGPGALGGALVQGGLPGVGDQVLGQPGLAVQPAGPACQPQ